MPDQGTQIVTEFWTFPAGKLQMRLDAFVRQCLPHLSRRELETAIAQGLFSARSMIVKKGDRLTGGDQLVFRGPAYWLEGHPRSNPRLEVPVIYEDHYMVAVNKPAGMPTHGFSARDEETLANFLLARYPKLLNIGKSRWEPGLVHRLDRETSGLTIAAKTQAAFEDLSSQFRRRQLKKIYWALARGRAPLEGLIDMPLEHDSRDKRRMRVAGRLRQRTSRTWKAVTRYRCLDRSRGFSFLEIEMETGVTHQIRVHLAAMGHPIVADALYGDGKMNEFGLRGHFLHARSLSLMHPLNSRLLTLQADLPEDLLGLLKELDFSV
jgi:23S rRNA pseudouridine1911/1915/1917 synthase